MERLLLVTLMWIQPVVGWGQEPGTARHWNEKLGIGINLGNALEAPREGQWGLRLEAGYFARIAEAGFDSVRIPIRWSAHAAAEPPYTIDPAFFARIDWAVRQSLERDLVVVINVHHFEEIFTDPSGQRARFVALWRQIADHYRDHPPSLLFEILNEPHDQLTHELWNALMAETVQVIRESNPTRTLIVGPAGWNAHSGLEKFRPPEGDANLIATIHYYLPFHFTHQGAEWVNQDSSKWLGLRWEGTDTEKARIAEHLAAAAAWGREHDIPLYLGEFGTYEKADMASRVAWTRFLREEARRLGLSVAYWEFGAGFGVYDREAEHWREDLLKALIPGDRDR